MRILVRLFSILCAFVLAACGGHIATLPSGGNAAGPRAGLPLLPRITPFYLAHAPHATWRTVGTARLPSAVALEHTLLGAIATRNRTARGPREGSSAGAGDSEALGVVINPGGPYTGIAGFQTAYTPFMVPQSSTAPQIQIGYPPGASGSSSMVAPLLYPSNGSCLAPAIVYTSSGVSTVALLVALDFCGGTYDFAGRIDDSVSVQQYVGVVNGLPGFYTVTLTADQTPTSTSTWYLLVYNFAQSRFDVLASKQGLSSVTSGLGLFLGQFAAGQCPITPSIAAFGMQLYNATSGTFEPVTPSMQHTTSVAIPVSSNDRCFRDDMSGPASFTFSMLTPNSSWQVNPQVPTTTISELSTGITPSSGLQRITSGPDGNLWFTEAVGNRIARITTNGVVTEFSNGISNGAEPYGITAGPDGNLWFTEPSADQIGRITVNGTVTEFSNGITARSYAEGIVAGPDGNVWFAETQKKKIGRITPSGAVTEFSNGISSYPVDITAGPDGNLWFTESAALARITPSGTVTEFSSGLSPGADPFYITSGPDGNLWFTEQYGNRIGRITTAGTITEFSSGISPSAGPWAIVAGADGNLWFTEVSGSASRIGRITPAGTITEFSSGIGALSGPVGIAAGSDGNLWFTETTMPNFGNKIGRVIP